MSEARRQTICLACKGVVSPSELQVAFDAYFVHLQCINASQALEPTMFWSAPELGEASRMILASFITGTPSLLETYSSTNYIRCPTERPFASEDSTHRSL